MALQVVPVEPSSASAHPPSPNSLLLERCRGELLPRTHSGVLFTLARGSAATRHIGADISGAHWCSRALSPGLAVCGVCAAVSPWRRMSRPRSSSRPEPPGRDGPPRPRPKKRSCVDCYPGLGVRGATPNELRRCQPAR